MRTTWRVAKVTATEGQTRAELERVDWFKRNPAYEALPENYDGEYVDEFIEAEPGEQGAEYVSLGGDSFVIDVTDGLVLEPGDNVAVVLDLLEWVSP